MKKAIGMFILVISYSWGMEQPPSVLETNMRKLVVDDKAKPVDPLDVEAGFGQRFDYKSVLNPDGNLSESNYKKRLRAFKRQLFDYVDGEKQITANGQSESSGAKYTFLTNYLYNSIALRDGAAFIPRFNSEIITNFVPQSVVKNSEVRLPLKETDIPLFYTLPFEKVGDYIVVRPILRDTKQGIVAWMPHVDKVKGRYILGQKVPVLLLSDADSESIALRFSQLNSDKACVAEKSNFVKSFRNAPLSDPAKRILKVCCYQIAGENLDLDVAKQKSKDEAAFALNEKDGAVVEKCCSSCLHLQSLDFAKKKALAAERNFLDLVNDEIIFNSRHLSLCNEIAALVDARSKITIEFGTLYKRVLTDLKEGKNVKENKVAAIAPIKEEAPAFVKMIPQKVSYSQRILRWFREGFAKNKSDSSIFYHTILPLEADTFVIQHGKHVTYDNKTHPGQKDDQYKIAGKIIDEETGKEMFCIFNVCLDPKKVCYHRDCKVSKWDDLKEDLKKNIEVEDDKDDFQPHDVINAIPGVNLQESPVSITLNNPAQRCRISLYKNLVE